MIHYLTLTEFSPLLEGNPYIGRIIHINKGNNIKELRYLIDVIKTSNYDLIIDLHNSLRSKYIRSKVGDTKCIVYKKPRWKRFMLFYFHVNRFSREYDIPLEYLKIINEEVKHLPNSSFRFFLTSQEIARAKKILHENGLTNDFIVVVPGAAWSTKIWDIGSYITTLKVIYEEYNIDVVVLGGSNEKICDILKENIPTIVNLKGCTDLRTSLAIISQARVAIGSDTGLIHGAEAVGTPVIMIKGPTSRETGAKVHLNDSVELTSNPWCRPCSKNGSRPCYREERICMNTITPSQLLNRLQPFLPIS